MIKICPHQCCKYAVKFLKKYTAEFCMMMMIMMNCFVVWLTDKRRLTLFLAGTIVRDPHHLESLTHREQNLNLCKT